MEAPALPRGKILLLAGPNSFNAAYLRHSLHFFSVPVIAPGGTVQEALTSLTPEDWASISACLAVDVSPGQIADTVGKVHDIPCLFVGYDPGAWYLGPYAWLSPPFASYQVIDTITKMMETAMHARAKMAATGGGLGEVA